MGGRYQGRTRQRMRIDCSEQSTINTQGTAVKIEIARQALLRALVCASAATPTRTPKDILKNVLMTGDGKSIEIIGTDQEIGIRAKLPESAIPREISESFDILLPPQRVRTILQELKDDFVTFEINDQNLKITAKGAIFRVSTEDPNEFPPVPASENPAYIVDAKSLAIAIRRTEFACDLDSTRYALGGINVDVKGEMLVMAATDSRRLSVVEIMCQQTDAEAKIKPNTVIPSKAWRAVAGAADEAEDIRFRVGDNDATFQVGNVSIYTRLVEGRFPRYRDVIPGSSTVRVPLPVSPFFSAMRQAQICLDKETRAVVITLKDGMMEVDSKSGVGTSSVTFPCEFDKEPITVSLDGTYVCDLLKTLPAESTVEVRLIDAGSAVMFKYENTLTYVLMPLIDN